MYLYLPCDVLTLVLPTSGLLEEPPTHLPAGSHSGELELSGICLVDVKLDWRKPERTLLEENEELADAPIKMKIIHDH